MSNMAILSLSAAIATLELTFLYYTSKKNQNKEVFKPDDEADLTFLFL